MAGWQKDARDKLVSFRLKSFTRLVSYLLFCYTLQFLYKTSHYDMDFNITKSYCGSQIFITMEFYQAINGILHLMVIFV